MTVDPVQSDFILVSIYHLESSDKYPPYNDRFDFLGYESSNFIHLIGTPLLFMKFYIFLCLLYLALSKCKYNFMLKIVEWLRKLLFLATFYRFFIEMALESCFAAIISI